MNRRPLVSVIVVTFNGRHLLEPCLESLQRQTLPADSVEVVVVDNASSDGTAEDLRSRFPWVRLIQAPSNLGFAGGNNLGIRQARGEFLALLNNDAVAEPNWLAAMLRSIEQHPEIGGIASRVRFQHDSSIINSAGLELYRDGRGGDRGIGQPDRDFDRGAEVFGPCGCAMLLRRTMLDDVGGFDERLFMYYEDLDLAWRARHRGWRFRYEPDAIVRHQHGASASIGSPFFVRQVERNRALVNWKNQSLIIAMVVTLGLVLRVGRAWWRASRGGAWTTAHAVSISAAFAAVLWYLPEMLTKRYGIRTVRRRVPDGVIARWSRTGPSPVFHLPAAGHATRA